MARNLVTGEYVGQDRFIHSTRPLVEDDVLVGDAGIAFRGPTYTACHLLTFHSSDGDKVGWLDWVDGKLTFGGDMAESARMFFEYLKPLVEDDGRD